MSMPEPDPTSTTPGMSVWGWMTEPELQWLATQASRMTSAAEVGCLHGRSSVALLTACPGTVYCCDVWDDEHASNCYPNFVQNTARFSNLEILRMPSLQAAAAVPRVDMVFLDGSHDYASVDDDLDAWLPKTKRLLCGHDYGHGDYPGVQAAVMNRFDHFEIAPGTSIWYVTP